MCIKILYQSKSASVSVFPFGETSNYKIKLHKKIEIILYVDILLFCFRHKTKTKKRSIYWYCMRRIQIPVKNSKHSILDILLCSE